MSNSAVREAIERTSAVLAADPAKAKVKSMATARLTEGLRCEVTGPRDARASTDMPAAVGGNASAPNPGWLLRAAMASCTATAIAMRAARLGIRLSDLEVTVESETDQRGLLGLDEKVSPALKGWHTRVTIAGEADAATLRQLVAWSEAHSPVGCTVRDAAACSLEVDVRGK